MNSYWIMTDVKFYKLTEYEIVLIILLYKDIDILQNILLTKYNINSNLYFNSNKNYSRIEISRKDNINLFKLLISPY
jgi:hypothetical protein